MSDPSPPNSPSQVRTITLGLLRPELADLIRAEDPMLSDGSQIPLATVNRYRGKQVADVLRAARGDLSILDAQVAVSMGNLEPIATNVDDDSDTSRSFGDKAADATASFGGSWTFLILFAAFLSGWMLLNQIFGEPAFDPFPFILLNLMLSTLAAVQAPIILMSQRRREDKDRLRSRNDYQVNLKAELEIRHLHEKMDHMLNRQWERLAEIQDQQQLLQRELHAAVKRASRDQTA